VVPKMAPDQFLPNSSPDLSFLSYPSFFIIIYIKFEIVYT
jgi:hypothetical protein